MRSGPVGGHTSVGAKPRSYQATPAGSARPGAGRKHAVHEGHQPYEPNPRTKTSLTLSQAYDAASVDGHCVLTPHRPFITVG